MSAPQISLLNQGKVKDWRKIASDTANALNNDVVHNTDDEIISGYPDLNNHSIDAVRYAMEKVWKRKGQ